jgi:hypothetical protein
MLGEDIEQRRQGGITEFSAYRFRRSRIVHIEPNTDLRKFLDTSVTPSGCRL